MRSAIQATGRFLDASAPEHLQLVASRPRRLLHVFPNFNVGGAQVRFAALAQALGEGFQHSVVSLRGDYDAADLLAPGLPVDLRPDLRVDGGALPLRLKLHRENIRALAPDLLVTYNWGAIEPGLANLLDRTPHLHMEDGFGPDEAKRQFARRVWTRRLALARSQVVVPSLTLKDITAKAWRLDQRRVHYIPNGLAPRTAYQTPLASLDLNLPADLPRIAWAGALRPEKNPLRLLRAFSAVKDQAVLIVIGDGPERAAVEAEARRLGVDAQIRLVGHRQDARDLIMQCDLLALSSDTEQMPFAVLEAMDAGLPVAATDVGDVRQMVADANRPFITPKTDADLAAALCELVASPRRRAAIGAANQQRLRRQFDLATMARAYAALFDGMIGARR